MVTLKYFRLAFLKFSRVSETDFIPIVELGFQFGAKHQGMYPIVKRPFRMGFCGHLFFYLRLSAGEYPPFPRLQGFNHDSVKKLWLFLQQLNGNETRNDGKITLVGQFRAMC